MWHLIGWEQFCHRNLAFVTDNKFYETGPKWRGHIKSKPIAPWVLNHCMNGWKLMSQVKNPRHTIKTARSRLHLHSVNDPQATHYIATVKNNYEYCAISQTTILEIWKTIHTCTCPLRDVNNEIQWVDIHLYFVSLACTSNYFQCNQGLLRLVPSSERSIFIYEIKNNVKCMANMHWRNKECCMSALNHAVSLKYDLHHERLLSLLYRL